MNWFEIEIHTERENKEIISLYLHELKTNGILIEDPDDQFYKEYNEKFGEFLEKEINFNHKDVLIKAYFNEDNIEKALYDLKSLLAKNEVYYNKIWINKVGIEWYESWKKSFEKIEITDKIRIIPEWENTQVEDNKINIKIEPGMAFGTGSHETTSLAIKLLQKHLRPQYTVFDIGCGSGILSLVASKFGAKSIDAIDIDIEAIKTTKSNIKLNEVNNVNVIHGNLLENEDKKADLIVANILFDILINLSDNITDFMKKETIFISSGILLDKVDDVIEAYEKNGLKIIEKMIDGQWIALVAKKR